MTLLSFTEPTPLRYEPGTDRGDSDCTSQHPIRNQHAVMGNKRPKSRQPSNVPCKLCLASICLRREQINDHITRRRHSQSRPAAAVPTSTPWRCAGRHYLDKTRLAVGDKVIYDCNKSDHQLSWFRQRINNGRGGLPINETIIMNVDGYYWSNEMGLWKLSWSTCATGQ